MQIAEGTSLSEPELFYLPILKRPGTRLEPTNHVAPIRQVRALSLSVPCLADLSSASRMAQECGLLWYFESAQPLLEIKFSAPSNLRFDLRPILPLIFSAVAA